MPCALDCAWLQSSRRHTPRRSYIPGGRLHLVRSQTFNAAPACTPRNCVSWHLRVHCRDWQPIAGRPFGGFGSLRRRTCFRWQQLGSVTPPQSGRMRGACMVAAEAALAQLRGMWHRWSRRRGLGAWIVRFFRWRRWNDCRRILWPRVSVRGHIPWSCCGPGCRMPGWRGNSRMHRMAPIF